MQMNRGPIDIWSLAHFAVGLLFAVYVPLDVLFFTFVNIGWEVVEIYLKRLGSFYRFVPRSLLTVDSALNKAVDILVTETGWFVGHYLMYGTWY